MAQTILTNDFFRPPAKTLAVMGDSGNLGIGVASFQTIGTFTIPANTLKDNGVAMVDLALEISMDTNATHEFLVDYNGTTVYEKQRGGTDLGGINHMTLQMRIANGGSPSVQFGDMAGQMGDSNTAQTGGGRWNVNQNEMQGTMADTTIDTSTTDLDVTLQMRVGSVQAAAYFRLKWGRVWLLPSI